MFAPKDMLTDRGLEEYKFHLIMLRKGLAHLLNLADDLHIGSSDDEQITRLYEMDQALESGVYDDGDGETEDDD